MIKRDLHSASITFEEDKILTVKFKNNVDVDVKEAKNLVDVSLEMVDGIEFYLLVEIS
jgi:hypothetical protein